MKLLPRFGVDVIPIVGPGDAVRTALTRAGVGHVFCPEFPPGFEEPAPYAERMARHARVVLSHHALRDRIANVARERNADMVFASRPFGWVVGGAGARVAGIPSVWRAGSRTTSRQQRAWLRVGNRVYRPSALVSNCRAVAESIHPLLSCESYLVPNGVDLERFDPDITHPNFRELVDRGDGPVLGVVARPAAEKGFDTLVQAMDLLTRSVPGVRLIIAGDYPGRERYETELMRVTHGATRFVGHIEDVENFYKSCDVICLASRERSVEGLSNAVLEAMAMERPVVATSVGGISEAITHGREGLLVPPDEPEALANGISLLLGSPELRARMGEAGRDKVRSHFSAYVVVQQLAEILQEIEALTRSVRPRVRYAAS